MKNLFFVLTFFGGWQIAAQVPNYAVANFSIYQNGLLIPYSTRSRISSNNLREISLQALSNIATGEAIDIRWNVDFGKVKLQNRIFTIIGVR